MSSLVVEGWALAGARDKEISLLSRSPTAEYLCIWASWASFLSLRRRDRLHTLPLHYLTTPDRSVVSADVLARWRRCRRPRCPWPMSPARLINST